MKFKLHVTPNCIKVLRRNVKKTTDAANDTTETFRFGVGLL